MSRYRRQAAGWVWEPGTEVCDEEVELPWYEMSEVVVAGTLGEEDEGTVRLLQDLIDRGGWLILGGMPSFSRAASRWWRKEHADLLSA